MVIDDKPEALSNESTLAEYAAAPDRLAAALDGLDGEALDLSCPGSEAGDWSIRQIAHHVVDGDDLWKMPIKIALGEPPGVFTLDWYWSRPQDEWAACWGYSGRDLAPSLALFRASRRHIIQLLEHTSAPWDRALNVRWPDGGVERVTLADIVRMQAGHASGHIADILLIRRKRGV